MKPVNNYLGVYPTRISRVTGLDVATRSLDSVVFQQGKSMLDYDLNVMQSVLKSNIENMSRQIFASSGIVQSSYSLSVNSSTGVVTIPSFDAQLFGATLHIEASSGTLTSSRPASAGSNTTFVWLEAWYQEIAPTSSNETISPSSSETKDVNMFRFGGVDINEYATAPVLIDPVFGAETTRRVQFRWRIRHTILSTNAATFASSNVFTDSSLNSNTDVKPQGGRTNTYLSDTSNVFSFFRADNYVPSTDASFLATMRNSLVDFQSRPDNGLYVAGRGTADDALALNTVDGRVYGLPLAVVTFSASTYTLTQKFSTVGLSTSASLSASSGNVKVLAAATDAGAEPSIPRATLSTGFVSTGATPIDLYLTPTNGGRDGYVLATRLAVSTAGTAALPSLAFYKNNTTASGTLGNLGDTGFFYDFSVAALGVSVAGNEIARFTYTSATPMLTASRLTVTGVSVFNGNITFGTGVSITGSSTQSNFPSLTSATFTSAGATLTGGTINPSTVGTDAGVNIALKRISTNSSAATPTNYTLTSGFIHWDTVNRIIAVGNGASGLDQFGKLGTTLPVAINSATTTSAAGTSFEVSRADHVHAAPVAGLTPATHKGTHLAGGSDAFVEGDALDANARVGIKISASGTGTDRATGIIGTITKKRVIQFIAGAGIYLDLSSAAPTSLDQLDLRITANNAGVLDTVTIATDSGTSLPTDVTLGGSAITGTSPYVSRRDHKHALSATYATTIATISSTTAVAGSDSAISRGGHQHAMPTYLANAIGFGAEVTTGATQVDIFGANNYSTGTSALAVRDTNATLGNNGGRIAFGGYSTATAYGVFGAIGARKLNVTSGNLQGYLSLYSSSASALVEFLRGYDTGGVYVGTSYFADPGANNLTVGGKIQVFTSAAAANAPTTGTTASTGELMRFMAGVTSSSPSGLTALVGLNSAGLWIQSTNSTNFATKNAIILNPNGGSVGIGTNAPISADSVVLDAVGAAVFGPSTEKIHIGSGSFGINRNVSTGTLYTSTGFGYQIQHTASTTNTADYLGFQVYTASAATPAPSVTAAALTINGKAHIGIGTSNQIVPLQITSTTAAADPVTTGTTPSTGEIVRLRTGSDIASGIGTIGLTTNKMWIQATDATALGTTNQLLLNPNGGAVGIGTLTPNANARLDVAGVVYATGFNGPLTGAVTGNVTGNLTGNVTGGVTGNVSGNLTGNVTGNVTGNLTGNVTGNVVGTIGATGATTGSFTTIGTTGAISLGGQGAILDEYLGQNQALRIYSVTAGKSLLISFLGGIILNNNTSVTGTLSADKMSGGAAPRCFIPAAAFTSTVSLSTEATSLQYYYSMSVGSTAYVYLVVPANYAGGTVTGTVHGGATAAIATSASSGGTYTALGALSANTGYYFKVTASVAGNFLGISLVFG